MKNLSKNFKNLKFITKYSKNGMMNLKSLNVTYFSSITMMSNKMEMKNVSINKSITKYSKSSIKVNENSKRLYSNVPHKVLLMPALSPSMEKGALVAWNKKVGEKIEAGDSLAKVETDKAAIDWESTEDGYIAKVFVNDGTKDILLGTPMAIIVSRESEIKAAAEIPLDAISGSSSPSTEQPTQETTTQSSSTSSTSSSSTSSTSSSSSPVRQSGERVFISPRAKVVAKEKGFNFNEIGGSGPNGRIILKDVLSHQPKQATQQTTSTSSSSAPAKQPTKDVQYSEYKEIEVNNIRRITAERLTQSKQTIPHYYLTIDCNVDKLLSLRQSLNEKLVKDNVKVSLNDMIIKASALSMRKVPQVNSHWYGDHIRQYNDVHINVAVDTERGLYVPVVRNAEKIGFLEISSQVRSLAEKAKQNKISLEELQGGTFTISNLGMFGINSFSAVINPPQSAILAVGTTEKRLVLKGKDSEGRPNVVESSFLKVTLSCDHRVIDGAVGASWLSQFRTYLEDPITMLL
eukprot:TRINITY_DN248_c0_g1_i2.p1 TRINITY_DN248_c0_g1~~TRINITY_DN248_c0_g1_i2.p1  ORF type:complete len:518 (-),score=175.60 TRINITY_DN248_c0_g1_i2:101-1654(-)